MIHRVPVAPALRLGDGCGSPSRSPPGRADQVVNMQDKKAIEPQARAADPKYSEKGIELQARLSEIDSLGKRRAGEEQKEIELQARQVALLKKTMAEEEQKRRQLEGYPRLIDSLGKRRADPKHGKPVLLADIQLPPNYAGEPVAALRLIAQQLRGIAADVQSRAVDPTHGFNLAGKLLIFALKVGAFSSPEWGMWRMNVEDALRCGDKGPTFEAAFFRGVDGPPIRKGASALSS